VGIKRLDWEKKKAKMSLRLSVIPPPQVVLQRSKSFNKRSKFWQSRQFLSRNWNGPTLTTRRGTYFSTPTVFKTDEQHTGDINGKCEPSITLWFLI